MGRVIRRIVFGGLLAVLGILGIGWLLMQSAIFNDVRAGLLEGLLTTQIGQPVEITGDVTLTNARKSRVVVEGVRIPSEPIPGTELARMDLLEMDIDLLDLVRGTVEIDKIAVNGITVQLLTLEGGKTTWSQEAAVRRVPSAGAPVGTGLPILDFLKSRTARFKDSRLLIRNEMTGFEFDFVLDLLTLAQAPDESRLDVTGEGKVNGQPFRLDGRYPQASAFTTRAQFGELDVRLDGHPFPASEKGGYEADLEIDTGDLGDLFEILRLGRPFEGRGLLAARVTHRVDALGLSDLLVTVDSARGGAIRLEGDIGNLLGMQETDLAILVRTHPENAPPQQARKLTDFRLLGMSADIVSATSGVELENVRVRTNLVDWGLDDIGPIDADRIYRSAEDTLAIDGLSIQAGPAEAPVFSLRGDIADLLAFKGFSAEGHIDAPARLVLGQRQTIDTDAFGAVRADFAMDDLSGPLQLSRFTARSFDTELWSLAASLKVDEVTHLSGLALDLDLSIAESGPFLKALGLRPVDAGALGFRAQMAGGLKAFDADLGVTAGRSDLNADLNVQWLDGHTVVGGRIFSSALSLPEIRKATAGLGELAQLRQAPAPKREVQPLVLPRNVQPLVLPTEPPELRELVDLEAQLRKAEVALALAFERITGIDGVSRLDSQFTVENGRALLEPIGVSYAGGQLNARAAVDLIKSPGRLSLSGHGGGWDLGRILKTFGVGIDAAGRLDGHFSLTGAWSSPARFFSTMRGSATVNLANGRIATSLLELAGLGLVPWIFSEELRQKSTAIRCIAAPVSIADGKMTFNAVTMETSKVQLVAKGWLDWKRDRIDLRASPRPVGRPLSRSALPFDVTGKLSAPNVKVLLGGTRIRRADGASTMPANRKPCTPDIYQLR